MGSIPVSRPEPRREIRLSRGPVLIGGAVVAMVAMAILAVVFLTQPDGGSYLVAGATDDFSVGDPVRNAENNFYIVKLEPGEFLALYQKDPHLGCTVEWRADFEFQGTMGWFRNPCHGETYDIEGNTVFGPQPRGLDRFPVEVAGGQVRVDTSRLICGPGAPTGMACSP